jgi:chromosomal replication initiation ATPase DnaA
MRLLEITAQVTGVTVEEINSKVRTAKVAEARHLTYYMLLEIEQLKCAAIAKSFGFERTVVKYGVKKTAERVKYHEDVRAQVKEILDIYSKEAPVNTLCNIEKFYREQAGT